MALQWIHLRPACLLWLCSRVPIVSHAASNTRSEHLWLKFSPFFLQIICSLFQFYFLTHTLSSPTVPNRLHCLVYMPEYFLLMFQHSWLFAALLPFCFIPPPVSLYFFLHFPCVGGFCHMFFSGWLRMRKCQWSLCMEPLRGIKEKGYGSVTNFSVWFALI